MKIRKISFEVDGNRLEFELPAAAKMQFSVSQIDKQFVFLHPTQDYAIVLLNTYEAMIQAVNQQKMTNFQYIINDNVIFTYPEVKSMNYHFNEELEESVRIEVQ